MAYIATVEVFTAILAGGFGKRLQPLSTTEKPKQFHDLLGVGQTLLQQTFARAREFSDEKNIIVVGNNMHKNLIEEQLSDFADCQKIYEPSSKNTAASIYIAVQKIIASRSKQPLSHRIAVILPADHYISGDFKADILRAANLAKTGRIVTFGINPTDASENYGYILGHNFTEKPNSAKAQWLLENAGLWNSGIFVARADVLLSEYRLLQPAFIGKNFSDFPELPFDIAIMEKTTRHFCLLGNFLWDDLGSWESLTRHNPNLRYNS